MNRFQYRRKLRLRETIANGSGCITERRGYKAIIYGRLRESAGQDNTRARILKGERSIGCSILKGASAALRCSSGLGGRATAPHPKVQQRPPQYGVSLLKLPVWAGTYFLGTVQRDALRIGGGHGRSGDSELGVSVGCIRVRNQRQWPATGQSHQCDDMADMLAVVLPWRRDATLLPRGSNEAVLRGHCSCGGTLVVAQGGPTRLLHTWLVARDSALQNIFFSSKHEQNFQ
jgi:hypothetical protein